MAIFIFLYCILCLVISNIIIYMKEYDCYDKYVAYERDWEIYYSESRVMFYIYTYRICNLSLVI